MVERSRPWNGSTVGDATEAPYDAPDEWAELLRSISGAAAVPTNLSGVFRGELNALAPSGAATPVSINTGRALTYGTWYENDVATTVAIPTPSASTRIDRIVLRKSWALQTVRITRIAGVEGGAAPALVQSDGTTWDEPICQVSIDTGGVITLTDERQYIGGAPMISIGSFSVGDILYASSTSLLSRLPIGANGAILVSDGSVPSWDTTPTIAGLITANGGLAIAAGQTLTLTGASVAGAPTWNSTQTLSTTGNALTATTATSAGTITGDPASGLTYANPTLSGIATFTGTELIFTDTAVTLHTNTSDGTDNKAIYIAGGGAAGSTRGAYIQIYGNEWGSGQSGKLILAAGLDGADRAVVIDVSGSQRLRVDASGNLIQAGGYYSIGGIPATAGTIRLANAATHGWRNQGNSADIIGLYVDTNDHLILTLSQKTVVVNSGGTLATTATEGFLGVPKTNGAPTGVPGGLGTTACGPLLWDDTNKRLYIYSQNASAWFAVTLV